MNRAIIRRHAASVLSLGLLSLVAIAANWNYRMVEVLPERYSRFDFSTPDTNTSDADFFFAGFPFCYRTEIWASSDETRLSSDHERVFLDQPPQWEYLSLYQDLRPGLLAANVAIWIVVLVVAWLLFEFRRRLANGPRNRRWMGDAAMAVVILAVPIGFVSYNVHVQRQERSVMNAIANHGSCVRSTFVPAALNAQIPAAVKRLFGRIHHISLEQGNGELWSMALGQTDLVSANLARIRDVDEFPNHIHQPLMVSFSIRLSRHPEGLRKFIAGQRQLLRLECLGCRLEEPSAAAYASLPNLREVNFRGSVVPNGSLDRPQWSSSVRHVTFPIGLVEDEAFELTGWPRLQRLWFLQANRDRQPYSSRIRLEDLPRLNRLSLDALRRFDLELRQLSRLENVDVVNLNDDISEQSSDVSRVGRYERLQVVGCPELASMEVLLADNQRLDFSAAAGVRKLLLAAYDIGEMGILFRRQLSEEEVSKLLADLGRCRSVRELELVGLNLRGRSLEGLAENEKLDSLRLINCDLQPTQISPLTNLRAMRHLDLGDCVVDDELLAKLFDSMPELETLVADCAGVEALDLSNAPRLRRFQTTPLRDTRTVVMRGNLALESALAIRSDLQSIDIDDVPRLVGLAVQRPMPTSWHLGPFRDLRFLMVGGANVDDRIFDTLDECGDLEQLMLAYTDISRDGFRRIAKHRKLRTLIVPNPRINDNVVRSWQGLDKLWNLNLSDCRVDMEAIRFAAGNMSLRYLALDRVRLSDDAKDSLGQLGQLSHLSLVGVPLDPPQLTALLQVPLDYLDLSQTHLSREHVRALSGEHSVRTLVARRCGLGVDQIETLLSSQTDLRIDLGAGAAPMRRLVQSDLRSRLISNGVLHSLSDANARSRLAFSTGVSPSVGMRPVRARGRFDVLNESEASRSDPRPDRRDLVAATGPSTVAAVGNSGDEPLTTLPLLSTNLTGDSLPAGVGRPSAKPLSDSELGPPNVVSRTIASDPAGDGPRVRTDSDSVVASTDGDEIGPGRRRPPLRRGNRMMLPPRTYISHGEIMTGDTTVFEDAFRKDFVGPPRPVGP